MRQPRHYSSTPRHRALSLHRHPSCSHPSPLPVGGGHPEPPSLPLSLGWSWNEESRPVAFLGTASSPSTVQVKRTRTECRRLTRRSQAGGLDVPRPGACHPTPPPPPSSPLFKSNTPIVGVPLSMADREELGRQYAEGRRHRLSSVCPSPVGSGQFPGIGFPPGRTAPSKGHSLRRLCCCCLPARRAPGGEDDHTAPLSSAKNQHAAEEEGAEEETELLGERLAVLRVESAGKEEAAREHRTGGFAQPQLVLRRGAPFRLRLKLSRAVQRHHDSIVLEFSTGLSPQLRKGTLIQVPLRWELPPEQQEGAGGQRDGGAEGQRQEGGGEEGGGWSAVVEREEERALHVLVRSCPRSVVARYEVAACAHSETAVEEVRSKREPLSVYILFNPWCREDTVYMESEEERQEYVLRETGLIYYGTKEQISARPWVFGQFGKGILDTCLHLLDRANMPLYGRNDPVNVARVVCGIVNSQDDSGVLEGNWSGDYTEGTSPAAWTGSAEILLGYHKGARPAPVRFGQCWVFSGVTTTVMRCLGIPCRSVTNFCSAHDTDVSLTTDVYVDEKMKPIDDLNTDSIWNFHVWNECWMARPDLPMGYGGWQVIDTTPQETSLGFYRCGPASVNAVRDGQVQHKYDAPFVFAEVNSDRVYWMKQPGGEFSVLSVDKQAVGHCISTKAVGSHEREDITGLYKHPEGSKEERIAVETACSQGSKANIYKVPGTAQDVRLLVKPPVDEVALGRDFAVTLELANLDADETRTVVLFCAAHGMHYTGVLRGRVKQHSWEVQLAPGEECTLSLPVSASEYLQSLVDQCAMLFTVTGRVGETGQTLATQRSFRVNFPALGVTVDDRDAVRVGNKALVKVSFTNPLPQPLRAVTLRLEAAGLLEPTLIQHGDVPGGGSVYRTVAVVPRVAGVATLLATLDSHQLITVHGELELLVKA
ncbi:protein-glutamine gamma-glutamyltransferase K-like [Petromyzon marinus]|uniref:protein-glutamine gamma-glutamyltransferase K-like n=1 Tax=Petromyzon marinus TaxID=7757 RepID=UPI003F721722